MFSVLILSNVKGLPKSLQSFASKYPTIWENYTKLGEACSKAGPLSERYVHLVKLGIFGVRKHETSFKTHVRRALKAGATVDEINHAILQLLTAEGVGTTVMVWNWAQQVIEDERGRS